MKLLIRQVTFDDGERYLLLLDEGGIPLYFPALYITVAVRGASRAANTIRNALGAIKALYDWQDGYKIDIESSFACGELLEAHQIHALRDFMQCSLERNAQVEKKVTSIASRRQKPKAISTKVQYARLTVVADYLGFLSGQLQQGSEETKRRIQAMVSTIRACRPRISSRSQKNRDEIHLDVELLDRLDEVLKPGGKGNPVKNYGTQVRNALMIAILRDSPKSPR